MMTFTRFPLEGAVKDDVSTRRQATTSFINLCKHDSAHLLVSLIGHLLHVRLLCKEQLALKGMSHCYVCKEVTCLDLKPLFIPLEEWIMLVYVSFEFHFTFLLVFIVSLLAFKALRTFCPSLLAFPSQNRAQQRRNIFAALLRTIFPLTRGRQCGQLCSTPFYFCLFPAKTEYGRFGCSGSSAPCHFPRESGPLLWVALL